MHNLETISLKDYCKIFRGLENAYLTDNPAERFAIIKRNSATVVSRLNGKPDDWALDIPLAEFDELERESAWIYDQPMTDRMWCEIKGKKYAVPTKDNLCLRQWIVIDNIMKQPDPDYCELLANILICGKYEETGAKDLQAEIEKMNAYEALPLVFGFFRFARRLRN